MGWGRVRQNWESAGVKGVRAHTVEAQRAGQCAGREVQVGWVSLQRPPVGLGGGRVRREWESGGVGHGGGIE
jgi:hypothetical protein